MRIGLPREIEVILSGLRARAKDDADVSFGIFTREIGEGRVLQGQFKGVKAAGYFKGTNSRVYIYSAARLVMQRNNCCLEVATAT